MEIVSGVNLAAFHHPTVMSVDIAFEAKIDLLERRLRAKIESGTCKERDSSLDVRNACYGLLKSCAQTLALPMKPRKLPS